MIFEGTRSKTIQIFSLEMDPGYNFIERFRGAILWYMMEFKDCILKTNFKFKKLRLEVSIIQWSIKDYKVIN